MTGVASMAFGHGAYHISGNGFKHPEIERPFILPWGRGGHGARKQCILPRLYDDYVSD